MIEIRSWLYVGKYVDTLNHALLENHGIGALLALHDPVTPSGIPYLFVPFIDGEPLHIPALETAISFVRQQAADGRRVLVACSAGISRSPSLATAVIKIEEERTLLDALHEVRAKHPRAMPDHVHWEVLCNYFGEDVPFWDIWRETL